MNTPVVILESHPAWSCPRCGTINVVYSEAFLPDDIPNHVQKAYAEATVGHKLKPIMAVRMKTNQTCTECELEVILRPPFIGMEP